MKILRVLLSVFIMFQGNYSFALSAYDFEFNTIYGKPMPLSKYKGKVLLVVNTASKCGYTPQFKDLQKLYKIYKDKGLVIIGVPSADFGNQEFSDSGKIFNFATDNYSVSFPLTELNHVSTIKAHPFYKWAYGYLGNKAIPKWNFHKLLINRQGKLVGAFKTQTSPMSKQIISTIETEINKKDNI